MKCTKTTKEILIEIEIIRFTKKSAVHKRSAKQSEANYPADNYDIGNSFAEESVKSIFFDKILRRI